MSVDNGPGGDRIRYDNEIKRITNISLTNTADRTRHSKDSLSANPKIEEGPDVSEGEMDEILDSLKKLTGFRPGS